jgi:hypothetical protein
MKRIQIHYVIHQITLSVYQHLMIKLQQVSVDVCNVVNITVDTIASLSDTENPCILICITYHCQRTI